MDESVQAAWSSEVTLEPNAYIEGGTAVSLMRIITD